MAAGCSGERRMTLHVGLLRKSSIEKIYTDLIIGYDGTVVFETARNFTVL